MEVKITDSSGRGKSVKRMMSVYSIFYGVSISVMHMFLSVATLLLLSGCEDNQELRARVAIPFVELRRYVEAVQPRIEEFYEETPFIGVLASGKVVSLHFAVAGRLKGCTVKEGQKVIRGQTLCWLDSSVVDLEIERAHEAVQAAEKILATTLMTRQKELYEAGVVGQAEFEQVRIQNETATAELRQAQSLLRFAEQKKSEHFLRAPWDGKVADVKLSAGQLVSPEVTVGYLNSDKALRLEIHLHAGKYGLILPGTRLEVSSVAGRSLPRAIDGVITEVSSTIDPATQMFRSWAQLSFQDDTAASVAVGMVVRGTLYRRVAEEALVLPASSLLKWASDDSAEVFVIQSGRLKRQTLQVIAYARDRVAVSSGLSSSDLVVRRFASDLYEGRPVRTLAQSLGSGADQNLDTGEEE